MDKGDKNPTLFTWANSPTESAFFKKWICYNIASFCLFVLMFWLFWPQDGIFGHKIILATCRISGHQAGIGPTPPASEGKVLTTEQPGKSQPSRLNKQKYSGHWRRKWQPTLVFLPEELHEQRPLCGLLFTVTKSQTQLSKPQTVTSIDAYLLKSQKSESFPGLVFPASCNMLKLGDNGTGIVG